MFGQMARFHPLWNMGASCNCKMQLQCKLQQCWASCASPPPLCLDLITLGCSSLRSILGVAKSGVAKSQAEATFYHFHNTYYTTLLTYPMEIKNSENTSAYDESGPVLKKGLPPLRRRASEERALRPLSRGRPSKARRALRRRGALALHG